MMCSANDAPNGHVFLMEEQDNEVLEKNVRLSKMGGATKNTFPYLCAEFCKRPDAITNMGRLLQQSDGGSNQLWIQWNKKLKNSSAMIPRIQSKMKNKGKQLTGKA